MNYFNYETKSDSDTSIIEDTESENNNSENSENSENENEYNIIEIDNYSINTEEENINTIIHEEDYEHYYLEKQNNHYYIGLPLVMEFDNIHILVNSISTNIFFKYPYVQVLRYLWSYSVLKIINPRIEILKLIILPDGTYSVIIKTFWIRIIQRKWKAVFKLRKKLQQFQMLLSSLYFRENNGCYPIGFNVIPGLKGLLVKSH